MTDVAGAITTDAPQLDGDDSDFDGEAAFLANLTAADEHRKRPSNGEQEATEDGAEDDTATSEDTHEDDPAEDAEETEAAAEDKSGKTAVELADDVTVKVKVDGKDVEVTLGDLKRLAGQEQALTQKSMAVAEARKGYETSAQRTSLALTNMLARAEERFKPYAELDYLKLSRTLDEVSWDQLRKDALTAQGDVNYLRSELDTALRDQQAHSKSELDKAALAAHATLSGPEDQGGLKDWGPPLYNELVGYAVKAGIPAAMMNTLVDPAAIRLIHKAMLFDKGKAASAAAADKVNKVKVSPTKVATPGATTPSKGSGDALARLSRSGSDNDAVDAFASTLRG